MKPIALVLGGGPDAERPVSIDSSRAVAEAIDAGGEFDARLELIDRPSALDHLPGDVIVPVLHGPWGEGGPLQDVLVADGRPFVGCGPSAARLCMDKLATKLAGAGVALATPAAAVVNTGDTDVAIELPVVIKPIHEGSSVGLHICRSRPELETSLQKIARGVGSAGGSGAFMVERLIPGRELTCGLLDRGCGLEPLPLVEITPAAGVYDFAAKYDRDDTGYTVSPDLGPATDPEAVQQDALRVARAVGVRHLARVDFMLDDRGRHWLLEINTMPGFTGHSLLPKAAAAVGVGMSELCTGLCRSAMAQESSDRARSADA